MQFIDLAAQQARIKPQLDAAIARVLAHGQYILGPEVAELEERLRQLLRDEPRRGDLGRNALKVVQENKGSIDRTVDMIAAELKDDDIYVAPRPGEVEK